MQYLAFNKYPQTYIFASPLAKKKWKKKTQSLKHKSAIVGKTIAFSICNKPFKAQGISSGRVKSREGLPAMIPTNILSTMLLKNWDFHTNHGSYIVTMLNKLNTTITSSQHPKSVQSEINIDSWGFNFSQSLCTPKFIGIQLNENNQGLTQDMHYYYYFCVGCAMLDSLKLSNWLM